MLYTKPKENYSFSNETTSLFMQKAQISVRRKNNDENFNARMMYALEKNSIESLPIILERLKCL